VINFYNSLQKKLFLDPYGKALVSKDVKTFLIEKDFDKLSFINDKDVKYFLVKFKDIYLIPLKVPTQEIFGIVFKSINSKNFLNYKFDKTSPLTFGLEDFSDFKYNFPIILTEGIKDCMTFKLLYKYSLSYLTANPSKLLFQYLQNISNRLIFIPDNDLTGKKLKYFKKFSIYPKYFSYKNKDFGTYWETGDRSILEEVKIILKLENL
jgi:hypothetical protein